ncbi:MAG: transketolase [bacterium]
MRTSWEKLEEIAYRVRKHIIRMTAEAGSGHPGGALSAVEILVSLYFGVMRYRRGEPWWEERDRFILSKGHGCPALYAVYAEAGMIPEEWLWTLRELDSPLQGHPDKRKLPILEASTGSLGQGLSIGVGMALAGKLGKKDYRVYVLIGDGESQEGQIWEAAMSAAHYRLDNLTAIMDYNEFQLDASLEEVMRIEPVRKKWEGAGWYVAEVNGHSFSQLFNAFEEVKRVRGKPQMILAHTVKGKGVSFMERNNEFHGKAPTREQAELALKELDMQWKKAG